MCVCMCGFCSWFLLVLGWLLGFLFCFKKSVCLKINSENFQVHVTNQNRFYVGVLLFFSIITLRNAINPLSQLCNIAFIAGKYFIFAIRSDKLKH